jgi:hypothetical protein
LEGTPEVEAGENQQDRPQDDQDDPASGEYRRRGLFPRARDAESFKLRRHGQGS